MSNQLSLPLRLVPASSNSYPLQGILIQGEQPTTWLKALLHLKIEESKVICYAIPDRCPNQIWGCLVLLPSPIKASNVTPYIALQYACDYLFLPEYSQISPVLETKALAALLYNKHHLLHPTLGLVELFEPLQWVDLFSKPPLHNLTSQTPKEGLPIPEKIRIITVEAAPIEESLGTLDALVPEREDLQETPLTAAEIFRLKKLRAWREACLQQKNQPEAKSLWARLQQKIRTTPTWTNELEAELEQLERRYKNPMNRLVDLLKTDPEKALRYAIPLNTGQIGRGYGATESNNNWNWMPRWATNNLFQSSTTNYSAGNSYAVPNNQYYELQKQYKATADQLIKEKKFDKAAFVYLRLLRDYNTAAETLIKGDFYEQAASIYLQYLNDEANAASCYEKANRLEKALLLYKKLENNSKVGDLYQQLGQTELAVVYYEKVLKSFITNRKYHTAAMFCIEKMMDKKRAFELCFSGWSLGLEPFKCLQYCLDNLPEQFTSHSFLEKLYKDGLKGDRLVEFLQFLSHYYKKEQPSWVRSFAYSIITDHLEHDHNLLRQILFFNKKDPHLSKDILRYHLYKRS